MTTSSHAVATFENRPFFELSLRYGLQQGIIPQDKLADIETEAAKGMVQIATAFGSPYLRAEIELARARMVNLVSLYLIETSGNDLASAARLIRDHTFLTLSRGGSNLLKSLFAMPEYPIMGSYDAGRVEDFLEFWSRKKTPADYQKTKKQRQLNQLEISLAKKLALSMGLSVSVFQDQHCEADAIIRSAILIGLKKHVRKKIPYAHGMDQIQFAELLTSLRKYGANKCAHLAVTLSEAEQELIEQLQKDIVAHDLPLITSEKTSLDQLIHQLKERYLIRGHEMEDTANYDALVSKEWSKHTKGKNDIDAVLTLLLCIAAQVPNKVVLSEAGAKTLIKKVRLQGIDPQLAIDFVRQHAPHEKQASLLEDWEDFCEQAQLYLLDDWDSNFTRGLNFLHENCYIAKKKT